MLASDSPLLPESKRNAPLRDLVLALKPLTTYNQKYVYMRIVGIVKPVTQTEILL